MFCPGLAPVGQKFGPVPVADFGAKAFFGDFAHPQHNMGMGLGISVRSDIPMDIEIGDHAPVDEFTLHEVAGKLDPVRLVHLAGNGELDLAGELRVLAQFRRLDIIPELFTVAPFLRRAIGQHDFAVHDAGLIGEVVVAAQALITQARGRAIGGRCHRRGAGGAGNHFGREVVDRHDGNPFTLKSARRHDV
jgi:hypothetical protein